MTVQKNEKNSATFDVIAEIIDRLIGAIDEHVISGEWTEHVEELVRFRGEFAFHRATVELGEYDVATVDGLLTDYSAFLDRVRKG